MPELDYKNFGSHLKTLSQSDLAPVYLFWGEEYLYQQALEELLGKIFATRDRHLNYDVIDEAPDNIHEVVEKINTYALLSGPKVVALKDSKIFYSELSSESFLDKAKSAYDSNDIKKAARHVLNLIGKLKLSYEDLLEKKDREARLKYDPDVFGDGLWLEKIIDYCRGQGLSIPAAADQADILQKAIEKGFPDGNRLIITTDMVDKRRSLYKCVLKMGTVVNCFVPKGDRRVEKAAQREVLMDQLHVVLTRAGKTIQKEAVDVLLEMTGFDLRTLNANLEKLISYAGDRTEISVDDTEAVLERTKKDPLYELTNAIAERDLTRAVFYLDSLLSDNFFPLQLLAAMANQVRRLLILRDFMESGHGDCWQGPGMSFQRFRDTVMPALQLYDQDTLNRLAEWEKIKTMAEPDETDQSSKAKEKLATDIAIIKSPQNAYPVFLLSQNAHRFSMGELQVALATIAEADLQLKTTSKNPRLILENIIFKICRDAKETDRPRRNSEENRRSIVT